MSAPQPTGSLRVSTSNTSYFANEAQGDVIISAGSNAQRILVGNSAGDYATLSLGSNTADVAGTVNAQDVSANTVQTTDIYLTTYDPRNSNSLQVIEPLYGAHLPTVAAAEFASNVAVWSSNNGGGTLTPSISNLTVSGNILPTQNHVQSIGTSNNSFKDAWVDSLHIASNTLYLGDTPVLGTSAQTIMVTADEDQSINVKTIGTGLSSMTSVAGVNLSVSGLNAQVVVQATGSGGKCVMGATTEIVCTAPLTSFSGDATLNGTVTTKGLTVNGPVVLNGSNFIANVQTVEIQDNILMVNAGQVGTGVSAGQAGLRVDRGDGVDYLCVFDETQQMFQMGAVGSLETVATRPYVVANACMRTSNLSDVANKATACANLGLGTACNVTFATATLGGALAASNLTASNVHVAGDAQVTGALTVTGFIGIGKSNPTVALDVAGRAAFTGAVTINSNLTVNCNVSISKEAAGYLNGVTIDNTNVNWGSGSQLALSTGANYVVNVGQASGASSNYMFVDMSRSTSNSTERLLQICSTTSGYKNIQFNGTEMALSNAFAGGQIGMTVHNTDPNYGSKSYMWMRTGTLNFSKFEHDQWNDGLQKCVLYMTRPYSASSNAVMEWQNYAASTTAVVHGNFTVNGALSKTSGTFDIAHPDPAKASIGTRLRHSFVEAPTRGDNMYTFKVTTTQPNESFTIDLPDYFPWLNEHPRVFISCEAEDVLTRCCARVNDALTCVRGLCEAPSTYTVLVIGTRKDVAACTNFDTLGVEYTPTAPSSQAQ